MLGKFSSAQRMMLKLKENSFRLLMREDYTCKSILLKAIGINSDQKLYEWGNVDRY